MFISKFKRAFKNLNILRLRIQKEEINDSIQLLANCLFMTIYLIRIVRAHTLTKHIIITPKIEIELSSVFLLINFLHKNTSFFQKFLCVSCQYFLCHPLIRSITDYLNTKFFYLSHTCLTRTGIMLITKSIFSISI